MQQWIKNNFGSDYEVDEQTKEIYKLDNGAVDTKKSTT